MSKNKLTDYELIGCGNGDGYGSSELYEYFSKLKINALPYDIPTRVLNYCTVEMDTYEYKFKLYMVWHIMADKLYRGVMAWVGIFRRI